MLFTIVFASLFPFIKFIKYKTVEIPALESASPEIMDIGQSLANPESAISLWSQNNINSITVYLYLIVSSLILVRLLYMLIRFCVNLFKHSKVETLFGKKVIVSDHWNQTFSFFGFIVLPQKDFQLKENQLLIQHELVHVKQYHSLDLLLAELFQVLHWFNPFAHLIKSDMREVHEFLADFNVVKDGTSKYAYQQLLLNYLANSAAPRVANSFSAKLLKKRFAMMTTNKTPKTTLIKYTLVIPVIAVLIGLMSFQTKIQYIEKQTDQEIQRKSIVSATEKVSQPQSTEKAWTFNTLAKNDPYEKMVTRLKEYAKDYAELKLFQVNGENTSFEIPVILTQGYVYRIYLVGERENEIMKNFVSVIKKTNIDESSNIKSHKIDCFNGYSITEYTCTETHAYNLMISTKNINDKFIIGLFLKESAELKGDSKQETPIIEYNKHLTKQDSSDRNVFFVVDEMPKFDNRGLEAARDYIAKNMKYPDSAIKKGIQGQVFVTFIIEKDGSVSNAKIERGVDPVLDEEAIRVVESMPKWTPGYQNGTAVRVRFTIPTTFILNENKLQNSEPKNTAVIIVENYEPFVMVEKMPKFDNSDDISSVAKYLAQNIQYPVIAKEKGIQGKVFVTFVIEENGSVSGAKIEQGVDPGLDKEAIRVIESMPKWTPGYQKGKAVRVKFTLPIVFKLDNKK
ncbi:hypothetical protein CYCD_03280 [Tenuifilaceae bacterium CYCD]|nr:hypothetical protein CYCD_03280 [Tenuifilaceae bacterium CYCD]